MYSPPTAIPCSRRNTSSRTGAASPIVAALGQHADAEGRNRHRQHRPDQRLLAAEPVTNPAEQRAAYGTHEEPGGKGAERSEQGGRRIAGGEEVRADLLSEESKEGEVVPLEHIAHEACDHTPAHGSRSAELLRDYAGRRDGIGYGGHDGSSWGKRRPRYRVLDRHARGARPSTLPARPSRQLPARRNA